MVNGIDAFEWHFREYKEQYAVIGGFACDLLMQEAGLDFRHTVDMDMVLIVEALSSEFAKAFWEFIEAGGYQARQRDIRKHRADVFRLYQLVRPAERIPVSQEVLQDIHAFILKMRETEIRLKDLGVRESKAVILAVFAQMYVLAGK